MKPRPDSMAPDELEHRQWLASLVDFTPARCVVDLGCGDGRDLSLLASLARPDAALIGLEVSAEKLARARALKGAESRVALVRHDVETLLPFLDGSVDVAWSNNLLECVGDRRAFLREVHRVLRPGGQVVFAHWDWDSQVLDGPDRDLIRRAVHAWTDWQQDWMKHADGWMGRRLWATFRASGRFDGAVATRVLANTTFGAPWFGHARNTELEHLVRQGLMGAADHERLLAGIRELAAADRYFYSICCYAYVGRARAA